MVAVDVFLADPMITDLTLPALDPTRLRFVYSLQVQGGEDQELLEKAFRIFNVSHPDDYDERSLSVGDVVTIGGVRSYRCDWVGWQKLERPVLPFDELESQFEAPGGSGVTTDLFGSLVNCLEERGPHTLVTMGSQSRGSHRWLRSFWAALKRIPFHFRSS